MYANIRNIKIPNNRIRNRKEQIHLCFMIQPSDESRLMINLILQHYFKKCTTYYCD